MVYSVSVIIPTHNRKKTILRAIESAIVQTIVVSEIIIIDDGSTDNTHELDFPPHSNIKLIRNDKPLGGAVARNQGAALAISDYLAFLDSDDEWFPDHLKNSIYFLNKNNYSGVFSSFTISYDNGLNQISPSFRNKFDNENILSYILTSGDGGDIRTSTMVFKRISFLEVKFDEQLKKYQDWDLAIRFDLRFGLKSINQRGAILHVSSDDRMSAKLNLEATKLFFEKHENYFENRLKFVFFLKLAYKASLVESRKSGAYNFSIDMAKKFIHFDKSLKNIIALNILNLPFVNFAKFYFKFKRKLKR